MREEWAKSQRLNVVTLYQKIKEVDPEIYSLIIQELNRLRENLELIASENVVSIAVLEAAASVLTNKYAEGYPRARWYGGCSYVDKVEEIARERARKLFRAEHANVQPHSGTQANMAVYLAVLKPGDTILALDIASGGHLSHGHPKNFSGMIYNVVTYGVDPDTNFINYESIRDLAKKHKPKIIVVGHSAYPRILDFQKFKEIADEVSAYVMADIAHIAGLVIAGFHPNPCDAGVDFVTSTTHKTLRGARGGLILTPQKYAKLIDASVFPGIQGGPLLHIIAAKAVAFKEASRPEFIEYQNQIVKNARTLAQEFDRKGYRLITGGTDNHLLLLDLHSTYGITGKDASQWLESANITVNKNLIPYDKLSPFVTSGIRIGTPAVTTRGMKEEEMIIIVDLIDRVLRSKGDEKVIAEVREEVLELLKNFPLYPEIGDE
ncbi:MAG: serine hydroxymethyltransferase [Candidatus Omnitrophota bacterium]|nr:MAG: serine hydroxymethyltransferase [Candidatus Omnitrophota bacterium]